MSRIPSSLLSIPLLLTLWLLLPVALIFFQPVLSPVSCPSCLLHPRRLQALLYSLVSLRQPDRTGDGDDDHDSPSADDDEDDDHHGVHSTHCFCTSPTLPLFVRCTARQGPSKKTLLPLRSPHPTPRSPVFSSSLRNDAPPSVARSPHPIRLPLPPFTLSSTLFILLLPFSFSPSTLTFTPGIHHDIQRLSLRILVEQDPAQLPSKGRGLFIVNNAAERDLVLMTLHAVYDVNTDLHSSTFFALVGARTIVVSNTHRYANLAGSNCQYGVKSSDMAHNVGSYFDTAAHAVTDVYGLYHQTLGDHVTTGDDKADHFTILQFHGMGASSCRGFDAYITPGLNHSSLNDYKTTALQPAFVTAAAAAVREANMTDGVRLNYAAPVSVAVPGNGLPCRMNGVTNVQGIVLNGVPRGLECDQAARASSGRFIHIDQKWMIRLSQFYDLWAQKIRQVL